MSIQKDIAEQLSGREYETEFSMEHPCSMTFGHSTPDSQDSILEKWIGSLPDSHASHSPLPVISLARPMNETSGQRQGTQLASYDRNTSSWRMSQGLPPCKNSLYSVLKRYNNLVFSVRKIVSKAVGESFVICSKLSAPATSVEFLETWPKSGMIVNGILSGRKTVVQGTRGIDCGYWPTPDACATERFNQSPSPGGKKRPTLALAVKMWATPRANDAQKRGQVSSDPRNGLPGQVLAFPTPRSSDCNGTGIVGSKSHTHDKKRLKLTGAVEPTKKGDQLNPDWTEWLMGWPIGWTDLRPLETDGMEAWCQEFLR